MKKILIIALTLFSTHVFAQQQQVDTTKKYVLTLTEGEYQALQEKLNEAAMYEAQLQRDKTAAAYEDFLKKNTKEITKKESK